MKDAPGLRRLLPPSLAETDLAWFRKLASSEVPVVGPFLRPLSNAANRSRLWMVISILLGLLGGRFGRRAALRGMVSVGVTSLVVNIPAKWIAQRLRPESSLVPQTRRLLRIPRSSSFPSGHAASAFAFTAGAAQEVPWLAAPLGALASGVAFSRVYTGVHYPSDVVVGAVLGTTIGMAGRLWWPVASRDPAATRPTFTARSAEPLPDGSGLTVVVNRSSGDVFADPADKLRQLLPAASVVEAAPDGLEQALREALPVSRAVGIAGGDGSVSLAAGLAHAAAKPLVVFPAGTLNHLARDLAIDTVEEAVEAVHEGQAVGIDVASIAGRTFVNTASFGAYSHLVDAREKLEGMIGKWPAFVVGLFQVLRTSTPIEVEIDGHSRRIWMIFVGNSRYHPSGFAPSWRERLDDGLLDVRLIDAHQPWARTRLMAALLTGRLGRSRVYEEWTTRQVRIRSLQGPLRLAADGETFDGPEEFEIRKEDQPLVVYLPEVRAGSDER
ncbi:MAG TPA: phosphatase PAP2 family protein [Acidimicrobiia bacterium]|nr:phosphatase PAP2 family protein [Acidimicrobiia bacterium]